MKRINFKNLFIVLVWIALSLVSIVIGWIVVGLIIYILGTAGLVTYASSTVSVGIGAMAYRWWTTRA